MKDELALQLDCYQIINFQRSDGRVKPGEKHSKTLPITKLSPIFNLFLIKEINRSAKRVEVASSPVIEATRSASPFFTKVEHCGPRTYQGKGKLPRMVAKVADGMTLHAGDLN